MHPQLQGHIDGPAVIDMKPVARALLATGRIAVPEVSTDA